VIRERSGRDVTGMSERFRRMRASETAGLSDRSDPALCHTDRGAPSRSIAGGRGQSVIVLQRAMVGPAGQTQSDPCGTNVRITLNERSSICCCRPRCLHMSRHRSVPMVRLRFMRMGALALSEPRRSVPGELGGGLLGTGVVDEVLAV